MGKNPEGVENQRKLQGVSCFKLGLNAQVGSDKPYCGKGHRIPRHYRRTMRGRSTPVARGRVLEGAGEKQQQRQTEGRFRQALQSKPRSLALEYQSCEQVSPVLGRNTAGSWVLELLAMWEPRGQTPRFQLHPPVNRAEAPVGTPAPSSVPDPYRALHKCLLNRMADMVGSRKKNGIKSRVTWRASSGPLLTGCRTLGQRFNLSSSQFPRW